MRSIKWRGARQAGIIIGWRQFVYRNTTRVALSLFFPANLPLHSNLNIEEFYRREV